MIDVLFGTLFGYGLFETLNYLGTSLLGENSMPPAIPPSTITQEAIDALIKAKAQQDRANADALVAKTSQDQADAMQSQAQLLLGACVGGHSLLELLVKQSNKKLDILIKQGEKLMSLADDLKDALTQVNNAINDVATKIDSLTARLASGTLSDAEKSAVMAQIQAEIDRLKGLASSTARKP